MDLPKLFSIVLVSVTFCLVVVSSTGLNEEFTWTRINFQWPSERQISSRYGYHRGRGQTRKFSYESSAGNAIVFDGNTNQLNTDESNIVNTDPPRSIDYQYENNIPMGVNVWKDKVFISIPRRRLGVPATLNYVSLKSRNRHNVPLIPYPNWNINLYPDTSGRGENLVSVYRFAIDPCDRMWLVDTGILELPGNRTYVRPQHQLVIINLQNDEIISRYDIPSNVVTSLTTLSGLTVDVTKETCQDAYVYFPDLAGYGLIVYNLRENRFWRVNHDYFYLESHYGDFFVSGHHFQWNDGVFSVELTDIKSDGYRDLYFHSMAGISQYRVSTRIVRNETLATRSYHGDDFKIIGNRGPNGQTSIAEIYTPTGTMFLGLVNLNALGCWNINNQSSLFIVKMDEKKMSYPSDLKIVGNKIYVLTTTMPGFLYGRLNYTEINFRVWSNSINKAIEGTLC